MLKRCKPADQPDAPLDTAAEEAFFKELHLELEAINRDFQLEADRTVAAYHRSTQGIQLLFCFIPLCCFSGPKQYAALSERAYWCRKYARGNAVALRKILKKHDKVCGNRRGREFLQQCWCSASAAGIGLFLHSPLLDELKAIQDVLHHKITEIEIRNQKIEDDKEEEEDGIDGDDSNAMASDGEHTRSSTRSGTAAGKNNNKTRGKGSITTSAKIPIPPSPFTLNGTTTTKVLVGLPSPPHPPPPGSNVSIPSTLHADHLARSSPSILSQSSDGLRGAVAAALASTQTKPLNGGTGAQQQQQQQNVFAHAAPSLSGSLGSHTSPSLQAQRRAALAAIQESPTCMLDSSDIEWEGGDEVERAGPSVADKNGRQDRGQGQALITIVSPLNPTGAAAHEEEHAHDVTSDAGDRDGIDPDAPLRNVDATDAIKTDGSRGGGGGNGAQGSFPDGGSSGVGLVLGPFRDEELRCPICLDVMYKPVGLGCGHKFCSPCALEAAGFGKAFGVFHNIISYIPTRTPCPQCRQKNVYKSAVSLREVGRLIKSRYPEQWAERKSEERRKRQEINNNSPAISRDRSTSLLGTTPFDLLT
jgi:RING-type zinc-finger